MECTVCSLISFFFGCIHSLVACALEYPVFVFILSVFISFVLVTNLHSAGLLCRRTEPNPGPCAGAINRGTAGGRGGRSVRAVASASNFDYSAQRGPHTWNYSEANQSPINIIEEYVQKFPIRELLTWNHYDDMPCAVWIENTGHTVIVRASFNGNVPTLSGADLLACYTFVELCFRWSAFNNEGSEHMINYKKYPLEIQAMHRTGPVNNCTSSYDLLMVAYLYEISTNNPYLNPIVQNLHRIQKPGSRIEIPPFPISYLCHQFRSGFYSYGGSLTQPPCYEGAEWFVFPEPLAISEQQLNEFRQLLTTDGKNRIVRNARPVQNVNCTRVVNLNQFNRLEHGPQQLAGGDSAERCADEESLSN